MREFVAEMFEGVIGGTGSGCGFGVDEDGGAGVDCAASCVEYRNCRTERGSRGNDNDDCIKVADAGGTGEVMAEAAA